MTQAHADTTIFEPREAVRLWSVDRLAGLECVGLTDRLQGLRRATGETTEDVSEDVTA
jgi:hypothetical protein